MKSRRKTAFFIMTRLSSHVGCAVRTMVRESILQGVQASLYLLHREASVFFYMFAIAQSALCGRRKIATT